MVNEGSYDLHTHTDYSDGNLNPEQLIQKAAAIGLAGLAITDHDTIEALPEAARAADRHGIDLVHGVEISTSRDEKDVHILAYFQRHPGRELSELLQHMAREREKRFERMIERLAEVGIRLNKDEVRRRAGKGTVGRPHVAQAIVESGYAKDLQAAFQKYLVRGKPAYVPREKVAPEEVVRIIRQAHAVPVLAHPGLIGDDSIIGRLVASGLVGIEVRHTEHTAGQIEHYRQIAEANGLIQTAGSDYHGRKGRAHLGKHRVGREVIDQIRACFS